MPRPTPTNANEVELKRLIQNRRHGELVDFMCGLSSEERRALHKFAKEYRRLVSQENVLQCAWLAEVAASVPSEISRAMVFEINNAFVDFRYAEHFAGLVKCVHPGWMDTYVDLTLEARPVDWQHVYLLYAKGHCSRPANERFRLFLMESIPQFLRGGEQESALAFMTRNSELLVPEIYDLLASGRLDELPNCFGPKPKEFNALRKEFLRYCGHEPEENNWHHVIVTMCEQGVMDPTRVLDSGFAGLMTAQRPYVVGWVTELLDRLSGGSYGDRLGGDTGLLALLGTSPTVAKWALKAIATLQKDGQVNADQLLEHLGPLFNHSSKTVVMAAIKLLSKSVQKEPSLKLEACLLVLDALVHQESTIHQEVAKFLKSHAIPQDLEVGLKLADFSDGIAKSALDSFADWLVVSPEIEEPTAPVDLRECASALDPDRKISPIDSVDELIESMTCYCQDPLDIQEFSRVLDGMMRITDLPEDIATRVGPLAKTITEGDGFMRAASGDFIFITLFKAWVGRPIGRVLHSHGFARDHVKQMTVLLESYCEPLLEILHNRKPFQLLSTPTHEDFWIDPEVLARRILAHEFEGVSAPEIDVATALLRMSGENHESARSVASDLVSPNGRALRYALGDDSMKPDYFTSRWTAAARRRDRSIHLGDSCPLHGVDGETAADYRVEAMALQKDPHPFRPREFISTPPWIRVTVSPNRTASDSQALPVALHNVVCDPNTVSGCIHERAAFSWAMSVWPANPDPVLAQVIAVMSLTLDDTSNDIARLVHEPVLNSLRAPCLPLTNLGYQALALGLATASVGTRTLAADILAANLEFVWFDAPEFGKAIGVLLETDVAKITRLVNGLQQVCESGSIHQTRVLEVVTHSLALQRPDAPRSLNQLLEFYLERRTDQQLPIASTAWLKQLPQKGALGRTLKKLL